ncbi:recombinase family protein [bacterium]|nr:recombinase family protein [bacterium]
MRAEELRWLIRRIRALGKYLADSEKAALVTRICHMAQRRLNFQEITDNLTQDGLSTAAHAMRFHQTQVRRILLQREVTVTGDGGCRLSKNTRLAQGTVSTQIRETTG